MDQIMAKTCAAPKIRKKTLVLNGLTHMRSSTSQNHLTAMSSSCSPKARLAPTRTSLSSMAWPGHVSLVPAVPPRRYPRTPLRDPRTAVAANSRKKNTAGVTGGQSGRRPRALSWDRQLRRRDRGARSAPAGRERSCRTLTS